MRATLCRRLPVLTLQSLSAPSSCCWKAEFNKQCQAAHLCPPGLLSLRVFVLSSQNTNRFLDVCAHEVLNREKGLVSELCPTPCDPLDCSPRGCSVHGISQARILEWVALLFFMRRRNIPDPGIEPGSPALQVDSLPSEPPGKPTSGA